MTEIKLEKRGGNKRFHIGNFFVDLTEKDYQELVWLFSDKSRDIMPELPDGLVEGSNCDDNFKAGWIACWEKFSNSLPIRYCQQCGDLIK